MREIQRTVVGSGNSIWWLAEVCGGKKLWNWQVSLEWKDWRGIDNESGKYEANWQWKRNQRHQRRDDTHLSSLCIWTQQRPTDDNKKKHFHTVQLHQGCLQCFDTEFWYVGGIDSIAVWSLPSLGVLAVNNATSIISSCSKIHTGFTFWHCLTQTALQTGHYNECCFVSYTVPNSAQDLITQKR